MGCRDGRFATLEGLEARLRDGIGFALRGVTEENQVAFFAQRETPQFVELVEIAVRILQTRQQVGQPTRGTLAAAVLEVHESSTVEWSCKFKQILDIT